MPADVRLTPHFFLSQFTVSPHAGRAGMRNAPLAAQVENLRRLAYTLELVRGHLNGCPVYLLRAFRQLGPGIDAALIPAADGRSAEFIAPDFGTPRQICAHLVAQGLAFDRLVDAGEWVQLDISRHGHPPRGRLCTGVFEFGRPMRELEGLV